MRIKSQYKKKVINIGIRLLGLFIVYLTSFYSYLLYHSIVELFSIIIAFSIFIIGWNSRKYMDSSYFLFLGIAYLFIGLIDLVHTLSFTGMGVFLGYTQNLPAQLWIAARYLEALSLLAAIILIKRKLGYKSLFLLYGVIFIYIIGAIFFWEIFPTCIIEGEGLTLFKIYSEYLINIILFITIIMIVQRRINFKKEIYYYMIVSIVSTILAEMAFTLYITIFDFSNLVGHIFKIISFYYIYKAIIKTGMKDPYNLVFRDLKLRERELQQANIHLKSLDLLKNMFLASMSHELRTPLNSIIGFTGWLLMGMEGDLNEEQRKQLTMVKFSANHLLVLINDILDISKIETGKVELAIEKFEISEAINDIVNSVLPLANDKGLNLIYNVPKGIIINSDKRRIKQILMNLVSNAIKFTDQGNVKIKVTLLNNNDLEFIVSDSGIGIKKEEIEKLFQPFQQVDMSSTKRHEGTGLGLYLCKKLLDLLHGEISVISQFGKGSEFKFIIPIEFKEEV
ncbi:hypothetical protein LCGC14_1367710 [marine sediment metagenome]|uniref:histidine kinase n=1 Tax=marine sediment metagenome TaxID=412755 RepID=A0A0F9K689_9ZZZZ